MVLADIIKDAVSQYKNNIFIVNRGIYRRREYSYNQIYENALKLCQFYKKANINKKDKIIIYLQNSSDLTKEKLDNNLQIQDAIIRRIEIIGEAVKNLPIDFIEKYPKVPWSQMAGMRDLVTHSYFRVNLDYVWEVIKKDLSVLKQQIQKIKEDLEKNEENIHNAKKEKKRNFEE